MSDIDQLCINTIRTLSIDAIQKANSGHPGAPMGMAAPTYDLWTERLRYDPKNPLWPNRDRFVSVGRSRLDAALFDAAPEQGRGGRPQRSEGEPPRRLDGRRQELPPGGLLHARPPRIRHDHRRRGHNRSARPGHRHECRYGDRREVARGPLQQARIPAFRLQHLRPLLGRRDDGGHRLRGCVARGAPQARQPVLDLRFQQGHPGWPCRLGVQRGCRIALLGLRLERPARAGCQ